MDKKKERLYESDDWVVERKGKELLITTFNEGHYQGTIVIKFNTSADIETIFDFI